MASNETPYRQHDIRVKEGIWRFVVFSIRRVWGAFDSALYWVVIKLLNIIQIPVVPLEIQLAPFWAAIFRLRGISYYAFRRTENGFEDAGPFMTQVVGILKDACEIRIAVGEMGSALMENVQLIAAVRQAYINNGARIEIVHGPRVDPKTKTIFEMAKRDTVRVTLYRTPQYISHHFFLITSRTGQVSVIDEGVHNETLWPKRRGNSSRLAMTGKARKYYVTTRLGGRARFKIRIWSQDRTFKSNLPPPRTLSSSRVFFIAGVSKGSLECARQTHSAAIRCDN